MAASISWCATPRSLDYGTIAHRRAVRQDHGGRNIKTISLCNLALPTWSRRGGCGSVIIISSIGGIRGTEGRRLRHLQGRPNFALARHPLRVGRRKAGELRWARGSSRTDFARRDVGRKSENVRPQCEDSDAPDRMPEETAAWRRTRRSPGVHHRPGDRGGWRRDD